MRFACICPPYHSHLQAIGALARGLIARGHQITFAMHDNEGNIAGEPLVINVPASAHDGAISQSIQRTNALCRAAERFRGVNAILGDQMEPASGLIAAHLGVPLISVACALPLERDPAIPLPFLGWAYDPSDRGQARNRGGDRVAGWILHRQNRTIRAWAEQFGIPQYRRLEDCVSPLLTISQTLPGFDYPRGRTAIVETGLLRDGTAAPLDVMPAADRPFVYVSLGTLQGHRARLLRAIVAGCKAAGVRVMVSHGSGLSASAAARLGADWTCAFAPQETALDRAALCVTHGGLNTAMEALERHVPMIVVPLAYDQFGVAARVEWHGVGLRLSRHFLGADRVAQAVQRMLGDPSFRQNAFRFAKGPGVELAVKLIEQRLISHRLTA